MRLPSRPRRRSHLTPFVLAVGLFTALLATPTASASAQLINAIKRKAAQAIEKRAGDKAGTRADSATAETDTASDESASAKGKAARGAPSMGAPAGFGMLPNAPTESSYTFDVIVSYELTSTEKGKTEPAIQMTLHFNRLQPYFGTKFTEKSGKNGQQETFAIFDGKNESMVMLMSDADGKMSIANRWKDAAKFAGDTVIPVTTTTVEKIGTRTISGYTAQGYRLTDGDVVSETWVTTEVAVRFGAIMRASSTMKQAKGTIPTGVPDGLLLESTTRNARDKSEVVMRATSIDTKASVTINMADYPRMGGPGL